MTQELIKLKREHFTRVDMDPYHYYLSFSVPGFEICLEPCAGGFDVAIYDGHKELLEPRRCTNSDGYLETAGAMFGDRRDEDWNKALAITGELLKKYFKDAGERKLREMHGSKREWTECKHGMWLSPCPICVEEERKRGEQHINQSALITEDEITELRARAKRITMQQALRVTMEGGFFLVIPMDLKSGYCVSLTILETPAADKKTVHLAQDVDFTLLSSPASEITVFSVGAHGRPVDPADAENLAKAVLQEYVVLGNLLSKGMTHFMKKVKM